ncbi:ArsR family transcriptional regulator [Actinoplanes hulinensis]|uniref:ArsR family transcriptional regulator n=1 Tax=Actinoplanes hulinensis TaxID=1144547 RepID=A0ABS7AXT7_9ACTN|nr:MarR family transcriptional regulator [Actinoplanes hulinensis]MBW6433586.1 ArsR family transcriptional regulator [Actinoplanes hulinensis]
MDVPAFPRLAGHPLRWRLLTELAGGDLRVRELVARVGQPQNLVSYHLRLLRDGGLVTTTRSAHDARDTYYHLDLSRCATELTATASALHPALTTAAPDLVAGPASVLFVCTGNSARSPIAEALLRHRTSGAVTVLSAGVRPRTRVHPHTARVLREIFGIDDTPAETRHLNTLTGRRFDHVITLCDRARENCPDFGGRARHWSLPDPGDDYAAFTRTAAEIDTRVHHLLKEQLR